MGTEWVERRKHWDEAATIPYFPNVSIGWADSPRFLHKGKKDVAHYNKSNRNQFLVAERIKTSNKKSRWKIKPFPKNTV